MNPRRIVAGALLSVLGVALGLGVAEIAVRVLLTDFYRAHERLGWTYAPGKSGKRFSRTLEYVQDITINSQGLHDDEHEFVKPEGTFRVVVLGDSFTAAMQVPREASYSNVLERRLNATAGPDGPRYEVINTGVDGYGTAQQLLMFRELGVRYEPDLVVLGIYLFNDLPDNHCVTGEWNNGLSTRYRRPYLVAGSDGLVVLELASGETRPPCPSEHRNVRRSAMDALLRKSWLYSTILSPVRTRPESVPRYNEWDICASTYPEIVTEAWDLTKTILARLDQEVRARGARLVVMIIPDKNQVNLDWAREDLDRLDEFDLHKPDRILKDFLEDRGIPFLELRPLLERLVHERKTQPYLRRDSHWNVDGHLLAGQAIHDWMVDHEAVPTVP